MNQELIERTKIEARAWWAFREHQRGEAGAVCFCCGKPFGKEIPTEDAYQMFFDLPEDQREHWREVSRQDEACQ